MSGFFSVFANLVALSALKQEALILYTVLVSWIRTREIRHLVLLHGASNQASRQIIRSAYLDNSLIFKSTADC